MSAPAVIACMEQVLQPPTLSCVACRSLQNWPLFWGTGGLASIRVMYAIVQEPDVSVLFPWTATPPSLHREWNRASVDRRLILSVACGVVLMFFLHPRLGSFRSMLLCHHLIRIKTSWHSEQVFKFGSGWVSTSFSEGNLSQKYHISHGQVFGSMVWNHGIKDVKDTDNQRRGKVHLFYVVWFCIIFPSGRVRNKVHVLRFNLFWKQTANLLSSRHFLCSV